MSWWGLFVTMALIMEERDAAAVTVLVSSVGLGLFSIRRIGGWDYTIAGLVCFAVVALCLVLAYRVKNSGHSYPRHRHDFDHYYPPD